MAKNIKQIDKGIEVKSKEYPVIYSYIYERESEDIKRLADKFKNLRVRKHAEVDDVKIIIAFHFDSNGKLIPEYETPITKTKKAKTKSSLIKKRTTTKIKNNSTQSSVKKPKIDKDKNII